jgi:hypothetical protein
MRMCAGDVMLAFTALPNGLVNGKEKPRRSGVFGPTRYQE